MHARARAHMRTYMKVRAHAHSYCWEVDTSISAEGYECAHSLLLYSASLYQAGMLIFGDIQVYSLCVTSSKTYGCTHRV